MQKTKNVKLGKKRSVKIVKLIRYTGAKNVKLSRKSGVKNVKLSRKSGVKNVKLLYKSALKNVKVFAICKKCKKLSKYIYEKCKNINNKENYTSIINMYKNLLFLYIFIENI